jgi:hypothetical protein
MYPDKFIKAADDIGMWILSERKYQEPAFAMFQDANIGVRAACIIPEAFLSSFGHQLPSLWSGDII